MDKIYIAGKVANYDGDLARLVAKHASDYLPSPEGNPVITKMARVERVGGVSYIMMVAHTGIRTPSHNLIMTVHGPHQDTCDTLLDELVEALEIDAMPPPLGLVQAWHRLANQKLYH